VGNAQEFELVAGQDDITAGIDGDDDDFAGIEGDFEDVEITA